MDNILIQINSLLEQYNVFIIILALFLLIWGAYSKIKYVCLKKATEMVSKAEGFENLTGEQKLAMCIVWIEEELPKLFRNTLIKYLLEKLINYAYENSFKFMKNYVKRKTGYDITNIIDSIKSTEQEQKNEKNAKE